MKNPFAALVTGAAAAAMRLAACSDGGSTTLARGDVDLAGNTALGDQRMDITAEEDDGEVTGEAQFNEIAVSFECADTETDGMVALGGEVTAPSGDGTPTVGERTAVIVWEGDPDSVLVWSAEGESGSCEEPLESLPEDIANDPIRTDVADGDDIEIG